LADSKRINAMSRKQVIGPSSPQLPLWAEDLRGLPWPYIRSALFAPIKRGARAAVTREAIAAVGDYRIIYTGLRLDQADLDVFQQLLHIARTTPLGEPVKFNRREFLRQLGRSTGGSDREWLLNSLSRLHANQVEIENKVGQAYAGSLIAEQERDESDGMHSVTLNPRLRSLYDQGYAQVSWKERRALAGKQLAQWLHAFVAGQTKPYTWKIDDLRQLCGSNLTRQFDFRVAIETAAQSLRDVMEHTIVIQWDLKRGNVTITRTEWIAKLSKP
jgi:hypothetical protein